MKHLLTSRHPKHIALRLTVITLVLVSSAFYITRASAATTISGHITSNTTFTVAGSPYVITAPVTCCDSDLIVDPGVTLTIEPGVVVKFDYGVGMQVFGALSALGTEANPIYFTSIADDTVGGDTNNDGGATMPAATNWLHVWFGEGSTGVFDHATFRYGGTILQPSTAIANNGGVVTVNHALITDNGSDGISQGSGTTTISNSEIRNHDVGIIVTGGSLNIHQSSIHDNDTYGVFNATPEATVSAENNYWGHATGPSHPTLNPGGLGQPVSDDVGFVPFLTSDPLNGVTPPPALGTIGQFKSDGATAISPIGITTEDTVTFKGTVTSPTNQSTQLQVELRPLAQAFTGNDDGGILKSTFVTSNAIAYVSSATLAMDTYHWRARAVDAQNNVSDWVGGGVFEVKLVTLYTQVRSDFPPRLPKDEWAGEVFAGGRATSTGDCGLTIAQCGCAITSSVMIARYYGAVTSASTTAPILEEVNPLNLDHWALATGAYGPTGNFDFAQLPSYTSNKVKFVRRSDVANNFTFLDAQLDSGKPQIARANAGRGGSVTAAPAHFIVIDGRLANATYSVKDPYWFNTKNLTATTTSKALRTRNYNGGFDGLRVFTQGTGIVGYLSLYLASPAELLVTDSMGRRTGKDPVTNATYEEIPDSSYAIDSVGDAESEGGSPFGHEVKYLYVPDAPSGTYTIQVIGTATGTYTFGATIGNTNGGTVHQTFTSETAPGIRAGYNLNLTADGSVPPTVQLSDQIPPEGVVLFDLAIKKIAVTGKDDVTIHPVVTATTTWWHGGNDDHGDRSVRHDKSTIYTIRDEAGNATTLSFDELKQEEKEASAELEKIKYGTSSIFRFADNDLKYEWSAEKNGTIRTLEQLVSVKGQFSARASYDRRTNKTTLTITSTTGKTKQVLTGLVIIGLETRTGQLILKR